ncbi:hypothetical protein COB21_04715 [Candidatus Aerophobetes bacterium]|uniref:Uncharacterized protein n=1 Tax=Aerophobetes bacterium TaxID=2030807 RepID=A0A2A4X139_UNCAE|nr:MAG: hypothetical protein COB21_04715 [Candidatus Aerophobetes bacterium]
MNSLQRILLKKIKKIKKLKTSYLPGTSPHLVNSLAYSPLFLVFFNPSSIAFTKLSSTPFLHTNRIPSSPKDSVSIFS